MPPVCFANIKGKGGDRVRIRNGVAGGSRENKLKGELAAVVGEKPKNQWGSGCVSEKKEKISQGLPGGSFQ